MTQRQRVRWVRILEFSLGILVSRQLHPLLDQSKLRVLVLNCGSSSLKFRLLEVGEKPEGVHRVLVNGAVKGFG